MLFFSNNFHLFFLAIKDGRFGQFAYVASSSARAAKDKATAMANLGGVHAANPNPIDKWDQAGIGDAEFLPLCIAAGCSPTKLSTPS